MAIVTLDARLTKQMSVGMQSYVRELVLRLPRVAPDLDFRIVSNAAFDVAAVNTRAIRLSDAAAVNGGIAEQAWLARHLRSAGGQLVHFMSVYAPRRGSPPHVYTIHDLIHLRFPDYFSWKVKPYYRFVVRPLARSARCVITDARATTADLQRYLDVDNNRVRVIPLAAREAFYLDEPARLERAAWARTRFDLDLPFFLYAGNHRPHKNLNALVDAWQGLEAACHLVITEPGAFDGTARVEKTNGKIVLPGHVSDDDLVNLYAGCAAAVQPSLYEGFGLAVLEAMAAGAPCIVAQTPALLEIAGSATLSFAPSDAGALRQLMSNLLSDLGLGQRLRAAGREHARHFSWDATAAKTAAVYREVMSEHA